MEEAESQNLALFYIPKTKYSEASFSNTKLQVLLKKQASSLNYKSDIQQYLKNYPTTNLHHYNSNGETAYQLIKLINDPVLNTLLENHTKADEEQTGNDSQKDKLFTLVKLGQNEEDFLQVVPAVFFNEVDGKSVDSSSCTLLQLCCFKGWLKSVTYLLENGTDVNKTVPASADLPPLLLAINTGNLEIFTTLLKRHDVKIPETILFTIFKNFANHSNQTEMIDDYIEAVLYALQARRTNEEIKQFVNQRTKFGKTILHFVSDCGSLRVIQFLFDYGASLFAKDINGKTPVDNLDLSTLSQLLNSCVTNGDETSCSIDYSKLINKSEVNGENREGALLEQILKQENLQPALSHPVLQVYINKRWRYSFYWLVIISLILYGVAYFTLLFFSFAYAQFSLVSNSLLVVATGLITFQALLEILFIYGFHYFKRIDSWINLVLIAGKLYILAASWFATNLENNVIVAISIVILTATLGSFLQLGKLRIFTYQVCVFRAISISFFKYALFYTFPLFGFAVCFYMLADDGLELSDTFYTVITMFGGDGDSDYPDTNFSGSPIFGHIVYVVFVLIIGIVLQNLLTGLAVKDMEAIQSEFEFIVEMERSKVMVHLETIFNRPVLLKFKLKVFNRMFEKMLEMSFVFGKEDNKVIKITNYQYDQHESKSLNQMIYYSKDDYVRLFEIFTKN